MHVQGLKFTLVVVSVLFKPGSLLRISVASSIVDNVTPNDWYSFIVKFGDI